MQQWLAIKSNDGTLKKVQVHGSSHATDRVAFSFYYYIHNAPIDGKNRRKVPFEDFCFN